MARTTERNVPLTELNIRGFIINPDDGGIAKSVYASDSGCIFINKEDAGGTVVYTLPAVADCKGKWFWFYNGVDNAEISVKGTDTGQMYGPGSEGAQDDMITSGGDVGDSCIVFGDGTYYYVLPLVGTWA